MTGIRPVVLVILDGWGERPEQKEGNAVALARTPVFDRLRKTGPFATLRASGSAVGLPEGQIGNSEVGHTTIGAGRIVQMNLPRINQAIARGALAENSALASFAADLRPSGGTAHLIGLASDGGVHAHLDHIAALAGHLAADGIPVRLHLFLDGRDVLPGTAAGYLVSLRERIAGMDGEISPATISGRYYAMDRDRNWDRTEKAWRALALGEGPRAANGDAAIDMALQRGETDEFVAPTVIDGYDGFLSGDGLLIANFRADRARQIMGALADPEFGAFDTSTALRPKHIAAMTSLSAELDPHLRILFPAQAIEPTLGRHISMLGYRQLRIAETEKYPHVTYFLNGGVEAANPGEERFLVPSPKVATYDLAPEMSARAVGDRLVQAIREKEHDLIIVNFANPDMVGHTGDLQATIRAVEVVDEELGRAADALARHGGTALVTADHGNAETMLDPKTERPHTAHTTVPVPCLLAGTLPRHVRSIRSGGELADIAPSLLDLMGIAAPEAMSGRTLLVGNSASGRPA